LRKCQEADRQVADIIKCGAVLFEVERAGFFGSPFYNISDFNVYSMLGHLFDTT
jgi:hypothetical protein